MTHHRKLDRWLQLGGHADGDRDLAAVALREAEEESGLVDLVVLPDIFDLDRHWIPERGDVPGHWHYDVRYVVRATGSEDFAVSDESHALAWRDIGTLLEDPATGSACANLGGWMITKGRAPMTATLRQGDAIARPSRLGLRVDGEAGIFVTGSVIELGRGNIAL